MPGQTVRTEAKRLHRECLSRVHRCHENGVRKWGGEEARSECCHHFLRRDKGASMDLLILVAAYTAPIFFLFPLLHYLASSLIQYADSLCFFVLFSCYREIIFRAGKRYT